VLDVDSKSRQAGIQFLFLFICELVLWIKDRGSVVLRQGGSWVLLKTLICKNFLNFLVEVEVSDSNWIDWATEIVFEQLVLFLGQLDFLGIQGCPEFSGLDGSLSKRIVILEELAQSDSVSLHSISNFLEQVINCL